MEENHNQFESWTFTILELAWQMFRGEKREGVTCINNSAKLES
jgi:hypothetical protein